MSINKRLIKSNEGGGAEDFAVVTYTADGTVTPINIGFQPDLVWIKGRSLGSNHQLTDSVRTAPYAWKTNTQDIQDLEGVASFDSNGFTLQAYPNENGDSNTSGQNYVAWCWKAGGATTVANTDGSIPTQVSANVEAGFSIVSYTGTGATGTIGHGLSAAPEFVILKNLNEGTHSGQIYNAFSGATKFMQIYNSYRDETSSGWFSNTEPTSSVMTLGGVSLLNESAKAHIAYCFHSVPGFSKFFSLDNTDDGYFECGFPVAFVMIKCIDVIGTNWQIFDNKRVYGGQSSGELLLANSSAGAAEDSFNYVRFTGTGFTTYSNVLNSSRDYIMIAFADQS